MNNFFLIKALLTYLSCLFTLSVIGQSNTNSFLDLPSSIPPSPTAGVLGTFGTNDNNLYTGSAQINLPIFNIEVGNFKLPISLNYKGGGVKINEIASWVGMGWTLNAGGCISRTQNGIADEIPYYGFQDTPNDLTALSPIERYDYLSGLKDSQIDNFYFNFGDNRGSFVITKSKEIKISNMEEFLISNVLSPTGISFYEFAGNICEQKPRLYTSWEIIDSDGNKFSFNCYEKTISFGRYYSTSLDVQTNYDDNYPDNSEVKPSINTWYLTQITTSDNEIIDFVYDDEEFLIDIPNDSRSFVLADRDQVPDWWCCAIPNFQVLTSQRLYYSAKRLRRITTPEYTVEFIAEGNRADIVGSKQLDKIQFKKNNGDLLKEYQLKYKYTLGNQLIEANDATISVNTYNQTFQYPISFYYRLTLTELIETDMQNQQKSHKFDYYNNKGLPNRASIWQDHWGYSNGIENDPSRRFHPIYYYNLPGANDMVIMPERDVNIDFAKQGSIQRIQYPTGGFTEYDYESHECISDLLPNPFRWIPDKQLEINYFNFPNLTYPSEYRIINEGTHVNESLKCHYIDFEVDNLLGFALIDIELSNYPSVLSSVGAIGFNLVKISETPELPIWSLNSSLLDFDYIQYECDYMNPNVLDIYVHNGKKNVSLNLSNGSYRLYHYPVNNNAMNPVIPNCPNFYKYSLTIKGHYEQYEQLVKDVGGIRVANISTFTKTGEISSVKKYTYHVDDDIELPSGKIVNFPSYTEDLNVRLYQYTGPSTYPPAAVPEIPLLFKMFRTFSSYPLLTTAGSYVGYSHVQEAIVDKDQTLFNGKIKYKFTTSDDYPDLNYNYTPANQYLNPFPYPPVQSHDYKRGKMIEKLIEDVGKNTIQKTNYYYTIETYPLMSQKIDFNFCPAGDPNAWSYLLSEGFIRCIEGHYVTSERDWFCQSGFTNPFTIANYYHIYGSSKLLQTIVEDNTPQGTVSTITDYGYRNTRINRIESSTSILNKKVITQIKYPDDIPNSNICSALVTKNMLNEVIEKKISINDGRNIEHIKVNYDYTDETLKFIKRKNIEIKSGDSPLFEPKINFSKYTLLHAKLKEFSKQDDITSNIIWSQNELHPIAETKNASSNECDYTGFENHEAFSWQTGAWVYTDQPNQVKTGKRAVKVNGYGPSKYFEVNTEVAKTHSGFKAAVWVFGYPDAYIHIQVNDSYSLSKRTYNPNAPNPYTQNQEWNLIEVDLPQTFYKDITTEKFNIKVYCGSSGTAFFDDLRFHPMDAQMTTYTYEPLIGVTSVSDINNKPTYYKYDGFNRLSYVHDFLGNILKKYEYHYKD